MLIHEYLLNRREQKMDIPWRREIVLVRKNAGAPPLYTAMLQRRECEIAVNEREEVDGAYMLQTEEESTDVHILGPRHPIQFRFLVKSSSGPSYPESRCTSGSGSCFYPESENRPLGVVYISFSGFRTSAGRSVPAKS